MPIPHAQLEAWSRQGSVTESDATYETIKRALEANIPKNTDHFFEVLLQGSYANNTNIAGEGEVDIVIRSDSNYLYDTNSLTPQQLAAFNAGVVQAAPSYDEFKNDVFAALKKSFGGDVNASGSKAIKIRANGNRMSADVVAAVVLHRYRNFPATTQWDCEKGICFFASNGTRITNYPKQHARNCTAKHLATSSRFKPMVRIFKNLRRKLVSEKIIDAAHAPSYFVEGLLYNVPNELYAANYTATMVSVSNWIYKADRSKFLCANEQFHLLGDTAAHWRPANCDRFLNGVLKLWNHWN